jgi:hypothetical protein
MNNRRFTDVDALMAATPLNKVTAHYGLPSPNPESQEYRLDCVFNSECHNSDYGQLTIRQTEPSKRIYCHSCQIRGNLLTLLHGLETHRPPQGGRLRGEEFKTAVATLKRIAGQATDEPPTASPVSHTAPAEPGSVTEVTPDQNVPLKRHEKEAARKIEDLYTDLIVDPAEMSPQASAYFRLRPWLTPEVCQEWGMGYLPRDGRSLFRGYVVYTHRNERDDVLSYSGRDVYFDEKLRKWERDGRPNGKRPGKHRYVSGYQRGLELYGQSATRVQQDAIRRSLADIGLIVVEGANDVIRLDTLDAAAVGLGSNRATDEQIAKIIRFARATADERVVLLPDCDEEGEAGFRDLLWTLNEARLNVRLGWSRLMFESRFDGKQPEHLSEADWQETVRPALQSGSND